jgi:hypothetical protein
MMRSGGRISSEINGNMPAHSISMLEGEGGVWFKAPFYVLSLEGRCPGWYKVQLLSFCHCLDNIRQQIRIADQICLG